MMNLEDRLRDHLHSGAELFDLEGPSATDIESAGVRRTRRARIGGALAAVLVAVGIVAGAAAVIGDRTAGRQDLATESIPEADFAGSSDSGSIAGSDAITEPYDGPLPAHEVITAKADGFVGLRFHADRITAITSDDAMSWTETATAGIPDGVDFAVLESDDERVVALLSRSTEAALEYYVGESVDGADWTVVRLDSGDDRAVSAPFLEVTTDRIVVPAVLYGTGEESGVDARPEAMLFIGTSVTDLVATPSPTTAPREVFASGDQLILVDDSSGSRGLLAGTGDEWMAIEGLPSQVGAIAVLDEVILISDFDGAVSISLDRGASWAPAELPATPAADAAGSSVWMEATQDLIVVVTTRFAADGTSAPPEVVVTNGATYRQVDTSFSPGDFVAPVAVSAEELLVQVMPGGLDDSSELTYVAIPLDR